MNNCNITRNTFKWIHSCRSSLFNNKLHFVCVNLPWSIRLLVKTNCSLRLVMQDQGVLTTKWSISCNLLSICWSQLGQLSCQLFNKYFIIKGLKSVYGIRQLNICFSNASLAYRSTTVLSWIPIYNQESMWKWHVYQKATSFLFCLHKACWRLLLVSFSYRIRQCVCSSTIRFVPCAFFINNKFLIAYLNINSLRYKFCNIANY